MKSRTSITSKDVAKRAGVSQTTVSRTFREDPRVLPETRKKVLDAASELDYTPNLFARSMITNRSGVIAVTVPDVDNPVFTTIIAELQDALHAHDLNMMLFLEKNFEQGPHDFLSTNIPTDGMIIASANFDSAVVPEVIARSIPAVLIQRDVAGVGLDRVMPDNWIGCRAIARHLVDRGHTDIGMIAGSPHTSSGQGRRRSFEQALDEFGLRMADDNIITSVPSLRDSREAAKQMVAKERLPTAVFCSSDVIALNLLEECRTSGIKVPDDLSVVGFDDIPLAGWGTFHLTTVRQDLRAQCQRAVELLVERIDSPGGDIAHEVVPVQLVERRSTSVPRA